MWRLVKTAGTLHNTRSVHVRSCVVVSVSTLTNLGLIFFWLVFGNKSCSGEYLQINVWILIQRRRLFSEVEHSWRVHWRPVWSRGEWHVCPASCPLAPPPFSTRSPQPRPYVTRLSSNAEKYVKKNQRISVKIAWKYYYSYSLLLPRMV